MNTTLKTTLIVLAVLAVAGGLFAAGRVYDRWQSAASFGYGWMPMFASRGANPMWDGGVNNHGPMMGNGAGPMMGGGYGIGGQTVTPLSIDQARQSAQAYLDRLDVQGLRVDEVMIFDNNGYVVIREEASGLGAFELLVDPVSKQAYPEHGPNLMWNLKYGGLNHTNMMGGAGMMMGNFLLDTSLPNVSADIPVTEERAVEAAQAYLDRYVPGASVAGHATKFYGYYTLDYAQEGKIAGMLSVNGFSAQVFPHNWHGTFIEESE